MFSQCHVIWLISLPYPEETYSIYGSQLVFYFFSNLCKLVTLLNKKFFSITMHCVKKKKISCWNTLGFYCYIHHYHSSIILNYFLIMLKMPIPRVISSILVAPRSLLQFLYFFLKLFYHFLESVLSFSSQYLKCM